MRFLGILAGAAAIFATASAQATMVTFEDQPAGPCCFASAGPAQTLVYNIGGGQTATFSGGVILTAESNQSTDQSNVYATSYFGDPTLTNPLVVTFSAPVQNFQIQILNALAGNYELSDNDGNTDFFSLATTGGSIQTVGFAATGTVVDISFLGSSTNTAAQWDFAIDNVTFNQPLGTPVPEPLTLSVFGAALAGAAAAARRRRKVNKAT